MLCSVGLKNKAATRSLERKLKSSGVICHYYCGANYNLILPNSYGDVYLYFYYFIFVTVIHNVQMPGCINDLSKNVDFNVVD